MKRIYKTKTEPVTLTLLHIEYRAQFKLTNSDKYKSTAVVKEEDDRTHSSHSNLAE